MSGPDLDLDKPNAIDGLDRLVTNFGLAIIAVFPTLGMAVAMPWRLAPLLADEYPNRHQRMVLGPGAFFPLALFLTLLVSAVFATPEILQTNGSFIGPGLAVAVSKAAAEGDIWKIVGTVMPIYAFSVGLGLLSSSLSLISSPWLTVRVSLRAAFYVIGTVISWIILSTAAIDLLQLRFEDRNITSVLYAWNIVPMLAIYLWMYFWLYRRAGDVSLLKSGLMTVGNMASLAVLMLIMGTFF